MKIWICQDYRKLPRATTNYVCSLTVLVGVVFDYVFVVVQPCLLGDKLVLHGNGVTVTPYGLQACHDRHVQSAPTCHDRLDGAQQANIDDWDEDEDLPVDHSTRAIRVVRRGRS